MSRPRTVNRDLPPRMKVRRYVNKQGEVWTSYYYVHPKDAAGRRKATPLGTDLAEAKRRWAEIEGEPVPVVGRSVADAYSAYMRWAEDRTKSRLEPRTIADRKKYWSKLEPVYGALPLDALLPEHILPYFHKRSSQVSAKKELKFLGLLCNWARGVGLMKVPNPTAGLMRQMIVDESRDIYVSDEMLALVYKHAHPIIQDALDLAYLTGLRPADVRSLTWDNVVDNGTVLDLTQQKKRKSGGRLRIAIEGDLKDVLDRILRRWPTDWADRATSPVRANTIIVDPNGQPLKEFGWFRSAFDRARDAAETEAKELGIRFERFQFRDLRPKAATDLEALHDIKAAQKLLGHTTERMTARYIRDRKHDVVQPVKRKKEKPD